MLDLLKTKSGFSATFSVVSLFVKYPARSPTYRLEAATQSALPDSV